ncbi:hypothetical protein FOZ61_008349 [Perkinsus olseni]|uniref:Uncharacterized protein n=1 Tax=Perkinsus olseni TaxID=32597 RepID=A0A7J6L536_PEROL|nr:hypothetical protein FOZ61_008349 [Perkinsus olseni]
MVGSYDDYVYKPSEDPSRKCLRHLTSAIYVALLLAIVGACLWSCYLTWSVINNSVYVALSPEELTRVAHSQGVNLFIPVNPLGIMEIVVICMAAVSCAAGFIGIVQHLSSTIRNTNPYKCILPGLYLLFLVFLVVAGVFVAGACFGISELSRLADEEIEHQLERASVETKGIISTDVTTDINKFITPLMAFYDAYECRTSARVTCSSYTVGKISCSARANPTIISAANEVCSAPPRLDRDYTPSVDHCSQCFHQHGNTQAAQVLCLCSSLLKTWVDAVSPEARDVWIKAAFVNAVIAAVCALLLVVWIIRRISCPSTLQKS